MSEQSLCKSANSHKWIIETLPWIVIGLAALFYCYEYLLRILPAVMVGELQQAFGKYGVPLDATALGHLSAFYYYAYSPMQLPVGVLLDKYGPRSILTLAVLSCAIGSVLFGISKVFAIAAMGRFLIGFGSAFAFVGALKLAATWLPENRFAFVSGAVTTLGVLGAMGGEAFLGSVVAQTSWQQTIVYSSYIGFFLAPLIWFVVRDNPEDVKFVKFPKESYADSTAKTESYSEFFHHICLTLKNPQIWVNGLVGCLLITPTVVFAELWGAKYIESVYSIDKELAPKIVSFIFLGWAFGGPLAGLLSDSIKKRVIVLRVGAILATVTLLLLLYGSFKSQLTLIALLFFTGFFSSVEIVCFAVGRENSYPNIAATVVAITNFIVVCSAGFQVLVGVILDKYSQSHLIDGLPTYSVIGYKLAMLILPTATLLAFFFTFFVRETSCKNIYSTK